MLLAFVWAAVLMWGSLQLKQVNTLKSDYLSRNSMLKQQQLSLDQKDQVDQKINYYKQVFQKSISAAALVNMVHTFVQETGMTPPTISSSRQTAQKDSIFNINSVTVNFNRVQYRDLVNFTSKVLAEKPYLVIDEVTMTPESINPTLMDGSMRINSLELKKGALDTSSAVATTAKK